MKDAAIQPALVIVYFGGNDSIRPDPTGLGPHVPLPEFIDNMKKIAHLKCHPEKSRVIFLCTPPVNEATIIELAGDIGQTNKACRIYSEACLELCWEVGVRAIDLNTAIQHRDDWTHTCFQQVQNQSLPLTLWDGIHLSSKGSKIVAREILAVLREADWEPSVYWKSLPRDFADVLVYHISPDGKAKLVVDNLENYGYMELERNL